ncbi:hypothetical protein GR702_09490 [Novosphingobium sp. FGD1]|jgi:hypothetical protein|uniref:Glycosyltransferase RgtA/B/C/D-like domain-containing protein n=1 Tax=Novosphingobium silvae TaxID=2692619 RepID=A0A7X4K798_9SPHN|nr:hypothetical protein [Novosphingobium silvae]MYL98004.1 hypothetical protein [Novosphingobium silvae]
MLASLTRAQALIVIAALALLLALSLMIRPADSEGAITGDGTYSDVQLYRDVAHAVASGEGYYPAATRLHRMHGFPTRPFITVRLPTLAWIEAGLGWRATHMLLLTLLGAAALAWFSMLRPLAGQAERFGASLLVVAGGAMAASDELVVTHELWAGVLVALALAMTVRGNLSAGLASAACALAVRELAVLFVLVAGASALHKRQYRAAFCWAGLLAGYTVVLYLHWRAVAPLSLPGDALSQGWSGMRGPAAPLRDIAEVTLINLAPQPLSYCLVMLALAGFLSAPPSVARMAIPYLALVAALLAVFARPVNFYWAILATPTVMAGLAFLPRLAGDLVRGLRRRA